MNILAMETATDVLHLALQTESGFCSETHTVGRRFSETLILKIQDICSRQDLAIGDLDLVVCTNGPGSFTGLRVGMASAKGISLAQSIPLVSLSTMQIMQYPLSLTTHIVLPLIDAKKQRFYGALFKEGVRLTDDTDLTMEQIATMITPFEEVVLTGYDASRAIGALRDEVTKRAIHTKIYLDPLKFRNYGESMIQLGKKLFEAEGPDDIGSGPTYIRKSDAEVSLLERNAKTLSEEVKS